MSVTVGTLSVDLVARTAAFQGDLGKAAQGARGSFGDIKRSAQDMGGSTKVSMMEARHSVMFLGEEFGMRIPRAIASAIAHIGPLGAALEAAFPFLALAIGAKLLFDHLAKVAEEAKKAAEAGAKFGEDVAKGLAESSVKTLELQIKFQQLTGGPVTDLVTRLAEAKDKLAAMQLGDTLKKQFEELANSLPKPGSNWNPLNWFNNGSAKEYQAQLESAKNGITNATELEQQHRAAVQEVTRAELTLSSMRGKAALEDIENQKILIRGLQDIQKQVDARIATSKMETKLKTATDAATAQRELTAEINRQVEALKTLQSATEAELNKHLSAADQEKAKISELIQKAVEYKTSWEAMHRGISAIANVTIAALQRQKKQIEDNIAAMQKLLDMGVVPGATGKFEATDKATAKPVYTGSAHDAAMQKIRTDAQAAQDEANRVKLAVESVNQKFSDQVDILVELYNQGRLTDKEFQDALKKEGDALNKSNKAWADFGTEVGRNAEQAALMGRSWQDALKAILIDLAQVILKLTVMNSLKAGGGGGGFFGSFLGGLFGGAHADGGQIPAGKWGLTGEDGPEVIYGGTSGVSVMPMRQTSGGRGDTNQVIYQVDARGSSITREQFEASLRRVHVQSVQDALGTIADRKRRS